MERLEMLRTLQEKKATLAGEEVMKGILESYQVPVPRGSLCADLDAALACGLTLRYPLVLKLASDSLHKTELGGVRLGIGSAEELADAFVEMDRSFREREIPGYRGILVEEQAEEGVEVIVGLHNDQVFGPLIMVGIGGIFTDLLRDAAFRMLPVSEEDIGRMISGLKGRQLLEGYRGSQGVDMEALTGAIMKIARFGIDAAEYYESLDCNPVLATSRGCIVVDAKMTLLPERRPDPFNYETPRTQHLENFFNPKSVAVVGASATEGKIGNAILDSLVNLEFRGAVYPINPNYESLMDRKAYPSLGALPETPDLVVVAVDLERMPDILKEMAAIGAHSALVVSGGGKELGGDRAGLEQTISRLARQHDIRIVGPNCIGSFDGHTRFDSFFYPRGRFQRPGPGPLGFITQSGTWGCSFMESASVAGVSRMVSYGNRVDVDEGDLIASLADDEHTRVIGSYIEGLGQGRKYAAAVNYAAGKGKPVVAFKTGRNIVSSGVAVSHTGAYGGTYEIYRDALSQAGVILTDSFHECVAACHALALQPPARGNRAALLSNGAGPMVNAIDLFPSRGLQLVALDRGSVESMRQHFSFFYIVENPVDVTGSATGEDYEFVLRTLMDDDNVDIIMPFFVFQNNPLDESIIERMAALAAPGKKPVVCCATAGEYSREMSERLQRRGIPVLPDIVQWVAAAAAMVQWGTIVKPREEG
ncbi:MAG: acetate--CoA ligase family protein [Spirochaetes bacterium]|nr:acetate--CoA ligase family protein [Spirochaetota bacterium]